MDWNEDGGLQFARAALASYGLHADTPMRLISLSENATYLVGGAASEGVLRVYRAGYQTEAAKRSELEWIGALRSAEVVATPEVIANHSGELLTRVTLGDSAYDCVMFEYVEGDELASSGVIGDDLEVYSRVGETVAKLHLHVLDWQVPMWFERMHWNVETILGERAPWGDWRAAPGLSDDRIATIELAEERLRQRLSQYPQLPGNSGLVHGDLRTTNIMEDADGTLWVIDFDDAGYSWLLWDLCSTTSFIEHTAEIDAIVSAWLSGYLRKRDLGADDLVVIPDLVFLRRLHLLAWIGSHPAADATRELGTDFGERTAELAGKYLDGMFLSGVEVPEG